jgi:hypothetical protein
MTVLDEAYERLKTAWLEDQRGFVNHGPMACEALFAMGLDEEVVAWAYRSAQPHRARTGHRGRGGVITAWQDHLGQFFLLDEWITHFEHTIDEVGWRDTVATWAPRLMPSVETKLFHALIRTAHATRAVENADTSPRRHELAVALGYWAARYGDGRRMTPTEVTTRNQETDLGVDEILKEIADLAARAAHRFVASPDVFTLHGVTGAMAVHLLAGHIPAPAAQAAFTRVESAHQDLFGSKVVGSQVEAPVADHKEIDRTTVATRAAHTGDVHAVKLTEAALRGLDATGDPVFAAAAETVTGWA